MITYISLIVAGLLTILGFFLKTTRDSESKVGKYFKKITSPGWIVFSFMVISFFASIIDQYFKDIDNVTAKKIAQYKDSLNTIKLQQLLKKSSDDSLNAEKQKQYLEALISSSKKIDSAQRFAIRKSNALNSYLRTQLREQAMQSDRVLNPLENLGICYKIVIPANQPKLIHYKERIIKQRHMEPLISLSDKAMLPDLNNSGERPFASFLHDFYAVTAFKNCAPNGNDRESLAIHSEVSFSREYFNEDPKSPQYEEYNGTKFNLMYLIEEDVFILSFEDLAPRQITRADMLSMRDFAGKNVVCTIKPGSDPDNIYYDINAIKCIDFKVISVTLETQLKKGRYLQIVRFQQTAENRDFREFQTKLEKNVMF